MRISNFTFLLVLIISPALAADAADIPDLRAIRSLAAEEALIVKLEHTHRVTAIYARTMAEDAREMLVSEERKGPSRAVRLLARKTLDALGTRDVRALEGISFDLGKDLPP